eukprot:gene14897-31632_t
MMLLARLCDSSIPLSGGALASRLHGHASHGDQALRSLVQGMMGAVCIPLWMLHGEIIDPYQEFFIAYNPNCSESVLWQEAYCLRLPMLPVFISQSVADKILVIGKSINFMRICSLKSDARTNNKNNNNTNKSKFKSTTTTTSIPTNKSKRNSQSISIPNNTSDVEVEVEVDMAVHRRTVNKEEVYIDCYDLDTLQSLELLKYGDEDTLVEVTNKICLDVDSKLLNGDFVTCLMDAIGPELKKRANQLYRHNLT